MKKKLKPLKKNPLISIVTPCFNSGKYIEECISSVLNQTYPHIEHIIQDGVSTDNTQRIFKKYVEKQYQHRIKIVSEQDSGQSDGLNKALQRVRGDLFLVLNADDKLVINACNWAVEQFSRYPEYAAIYGDEYIINEQGDIIDFYVGKYPYRYDKLFCVELVPPAQATFVRTDAFSSVGLRADKTLPTCPDYEMWVRLGFLYPMKHVFGPVSQYRHHKQSEGQRPDVIPKMVEAKLSVINRVLHDPKTPVEIKRLQKRAYAGLYHWGANVAGSVGLYTHEFLYLLLSIYYRLQLHKVIRLLRFVKTHSILQIKNRIT